MNKEDRSEITKGTDFIKKTIKKILNTFNLTFEIKILYDKDIHAIRFLIKTDEPNILIGHKGVNLHALSHVVKRIADKKFDGGEKKRLYFIIDVNNYQGDKIKEIKTSAHMLAQRAMYFKSSIHMKPLPPYERMMVHSLFSESKDFNTFSEGEGTERRVVIKYVGE